MNIYKFEFKVYLKSAITWSMAMVILIYFFMVIFPAFSEDTEMMDLIMQNYPEEMLKAFGMNTGLALSSLPGYLVFMFPFVQLCLAMQSANYGFSMLSIEERELTADFLMTKPVSRTRIFVSKLVAAITALTIVQASVWVGTFSAIELFGNNKTYDAKNILMFLSTILLFQLFFVGIGMLISVSVRKIRSVLSYSMAMAFGLYILNAMKNIIGGNTLGLISPFYYYEPGHIIEHGQFDTTYYILGILIVIFSVVISYLLYMRRNIHSV